MENEVVNEELTAPKEETAPEDAGTTPKAGDKTDPNLLLKSVKEERERRRMAEEKARLLEKEIEDLKNSSAFSNEEQYSDEGKALKKEISAFKTEMDEIKANLAKKDVQLSYPGIKEKWEEFEEFRSDPENRGMNMRTAAKAFLAERGYVEPRKGLESPTGGDKAAPTTGKMTVDEVETLRKTNYREYQRLIMEGKLNF